VASVDVIGGAEKRIQVDLDPNKVKEKGLSTDAVVGALSGAKVDAPVGSISVNGRETPVSTTSELEGIRALEDLPVGVAGGDTGGACSGGPQMFRTLPYQCCRSARWRSDRRSDPYFRSSRR
jgi:multidrug efflux pump subunit AcrB